MEKKYLFRYRNKQGQHKPTWYVRIVVPPTLQKSIGKQHIVISLKTSDISIAREKRHPIVNEIRALFERTRRDVEKGAKQQYKVDPKKFLEAAKTLHEGLIYLSGDNAEGRGLENNLFSDYIEQHLARRYRRDSETGHFIDVPPEIESEIARGFSILQRSSRKTFGETIELHLETLRQHATYQTIATRKARVLRFLHWLGDDQFIDEIERESINSYLREDLMKQDYSINTIKCHLSDIRAVFSWAVDNGMIQHKDNPVSGLTRQVLETSRGKKEKPSRKWQIWTEDELLKILPAVANHKRQEMLSVFVIALYSGMRREEIAQAELANIDDTSIYLPGRKAVNPIRYVPIHPIIKPLIDKLKGQRENGYLIKNFIGKPTRDGKRAHHFSDTFSKLREASGITRKGVVFHSLRHTFFHAAINSGSSAYAIDAITGRVATDTSPYAYSQNADLKTLINDVQNITHGKKVDRAVKAAIRTT